MRIAILSLLLCIPAGAQINLDTSIPAPQVKGIVQSANGGTGLNSAGLTGCPKVAGGVWTITTANCGSSVPFAITSFTGCTGLFELGTTVVSPFCSATYSSPATSAFITNTDGISSPTNLASPFTSATIPGNFTHTTPTTVTFTLTATGSSTQTATQSYQFQPAIFSGIGSSGASSSVTAVSTHALLSTGDSLPRFQLGAESVGQTFGPFAVSNQVIYLLLMGGTHTFIDANTGFPFAFNAPIAVSFVNVNGVTISMFLYQSTNALFGTYNPKVVS